jgi:hypothetical protein
MKKNQLVTIACIFLMVISFANILPNEKSFFKFKNLKVLPKNISEAKLDSIMDQYNYSLGVSCDFCHAKSKTNGDLVFESDAKPEKLIARKMMLMTYDINIKYFAEKPDRIKGQTITCNTCHRQNPNPDHISMIDSLQK